MTVKLLRAFDGHAAGMAYSGSSDVEADLLRNGNATSDLSSVEHLPTSEEVAVELPQEEPTQEESTQEPAPADPGA